MLRVHGIHNLVGKFTNPVSANPECKNPDSTNPGSMNPDSTNPASTNPASTNPDSTKPKIYKLSFSQKTFSFFLHLSFLSKIWRIRRFRIDCWLLLNKLKPNFFGVSTYLYAFFCEYCSCKKTEGQRKIKLTLNNLSLHINKIMQQWVTQGKIIILPTSIQLPPTLQLR